MHREPKKYPLRPRSHVVETTSLSSFNSQRPQEWIIEESKNDYGWDLSIEIPEGESVKGLAFFVQLKGKDNPNYINNKQEISFPLEITTINYLLAKPVPIMIALCDTTADELPVHWIWLNEEIKRFGNTQPNWQNQKTISLRIPISQKLSGKEELIVKYVRDFTEDQQINAEIRTMVLGQPTTSNQLDFSSFQNQSPKEVLEKAKFILKERGIIEIYEDKEGEKTETLGDDDRKRVEKIRQASAFLKKFLDQEAEDILNEMDSGIGAATDGIRAKYYNNKGVLALRNRQSDMALQHFNQAVQFRPNEKNYVCNLLGTQFAIHQLELNQEGGNFPSEWLGRLEGLLQETPDLASAIRLKAYYLSETENAESASEFLMASAAWTQDPISTRLCLADIYKDGGSTIKALSILEEAETLNGGIDPSLWSLKGVIQLIMALGETGKKTEFFPFNFGTKFLDLTQLQNSYESYLKALTEYSKWGFPLIASPALGNFSNVSRMLEKTKKAEYFCNKFLEKHPDCEEIQHALSGVLIHTGQSPEALKFLKKLYLKNKKTSAFFKNLNLALLVAEEFDELLLSIQDRQTEGFLNKEEEGLSRTLAAMALAELGEISKAKDQIQVMKNDNDLIAGSFIAEAQLVKRAYDDQEAASKIYRSGISQYPDDFFLLTHYSCHLGSPNLATAQEVITVNEAISQRNQLAPEQYLWLIKGYLISDDPEKAALEINKAMLRYPGEDRFIFMYANVLLSLGDEQGAYSFVKEYLKKEKTYPSLLEGAILAKDIGQDETAIRLFELAKKKTTDPQELGKIYCQLYVLKKNRGDNPKDILGYAMKFGKTFSDDIKKEVQFFIMVILCPKGLDEEDLEIKEWLKETRSRIEDFVAAHPQHPAFRRIQWGDGQSFNEAIDNFRSEIVAMSLPYELATTSLRLAARNKILPLSLRRKFFLETNSLFLLWEICTKSKDFAYSLHIWGGENRMDDEVGVASLTDAICIDITGLLTLAEFDLLDWLTDTFRLIYLTRGTKRLIEEGTLDPVSPSALAQKLNQWRIAHLDKIRIRRAPPYKVEQPSDENELELIAEDSTEVSVQKLFGDGVGETVCLAQKLGLPLYSDEGSLRGGLSKNYQIQCFSTLSFSTWLEQSGAIPSGKTVELMTEMIGKNFRTIPFNGKILFSIFKEMVLLNPQEITSTHLGAHNILGVFLRQFGDTTVDWISLVKVAIDWWLATISDRDIPNDLLPECMELPSSRLAVWRPISGVFAEVSDEAEQNAALLWGIFLWRCHRLEEGKAHEAWLAIKECCNRVFPDFQKQQKIIFTLIPHNILKSANKDASLNSTQRLTCFVELPLNFPQGDVDRVNLENIFRGLSPEII